MGSMSRNGTVGRAHSGFGRLAAAILIVGFAGQAFAQEDDQPMDEDQSVRISCDDGTELSALFDETAVEITLAGGQKVSLPQKRSDDKGFVYSNGKFSLSGDDENAQWVVGKKAPVACHFSGEDAQQPSHFDEPLTVDTAPLPKDKANPDAQPQVNCYRYAGFMIKEVDLGEKGAEFLAVARPDAACERNPGKDEKVVKDDTAGYFFGVKGNLAFFQAADGWNSGLPFVVYDTQTMKRLFVDSLARDDFDSLEVNGSNVKMTFQRSYSADCSLYKDAGACAEAVKKATGLGDIAQLPDCGPSRARPPAACRADSTLAMRRGPRGPRQQIQSDIEDFPRSRERPRARCPKTARNHAFR